MRGQVNSTATPAVITARTIFASRKTIPFVVCPRMIWPSPAMQQPLSNAINKGSFAGDEGVIIRALPDSPKFFSVCRCLSCCEGMTLRSSIAERYLWGSVSEILGGRRRRSSSSSPQCRHFRAAVLIISAQYGHSLVPSDLGAAGSFSAATALNSGSSTFGVIASKSPSTSPTFCQCVPSTDSS